MPTKTRPRPRRNAEIPKWIGPFIATLGTGKSITASCVKAGVSRPTVYARKADDEAFAAAWETAEQAARDAYEDEIHRRAVEGWVEREEFDEKGNVRARTKKYSDTLLIFRTKKLLPEYRDSFQVQHSGTINHAVGVSLLDGKQPVEIPSDTRREAARKLLEAGEGEVVDAEVVTP